MITPSHYFKFTVEMGGVQLIFNEKNEYSHLINHWLYLAMLQSSLLLWINLRTVQGIVKIKY